MPYMVKWDFPHLIQPQYPVPIDKSGRLFDASKLSCVIASGVSNKIDALSGKIYGVSTNPAVVTTTQGKGTQWVEGANSYIELNTDADNVLDTVSCSMLIATVRTSANTFGGVSYGYDFSASGVDRAILHLPFTDNNLYWDFGNATAGSGRVSVSIASYLAAGTINIWGFSAGSRGREIWRNGVLLASDSAATASRTATTKGFRIGAADATTGAAPAHNDSLFVLSKEQWSREALAKLTANPNRIFAPQQRRIYVSAAASSALAGYSRIIEIEAWGVATVGTELVAMSDGKFGYSAVPGVLNAHLIHQPLINGEFVLTADPNAGIVYTIRPESNSYMYAGYGSNENQLN